MDCSKVSAELNEMVGSACSNSGLQPPKGSSRWAGVPEIRNGVAFANECWDCRSAAAPPPLLQEWPVWRSPLCNKRQLRRAIPSENWLSFSEPLPNRLRDVLAVGLFLVLAGYVGFSGFRLALLLWQRFG